MSDALKDCRECRNSMMSYSRLLCVAMTISRPVEYMRDDRSECGSEAMLFEPKGEKRYAEYE